MRTNQRVALAAVLALGILPAARAQFSIANPERGVSLYAWSEDLAGSIGGASGGVAGTGAIAEDGETVVGITGNLGKWELGFAQLDHTTTGLATTTFSFDGTTYTAGDTFRLQHDVSQFDVFRRFTLVGNDSTNVFVLGGFKVLGIESNLRGTSGGSTGLTADVDETVPLPMLGLAGRFGPKQGLQFFGGVRFFSLEIDDNEAEVLEGNVGVAYRRNKLHGAVGYRTFELDVDIEKGSPTSASLDLENSGIYFEVGLGF